VLPAEPSLLPSAVSSLYSENVFFFFIHYLVREFICHNSVSEIINYSY